MSFLSTLRKLVLGETWLLPLGIAGVVLVALGARELLGDPWQDWGGFVLLAGACAVLALSVSVSARPRVRQTAAPDAP